MGDTRLSLRHTVAVLLVAAVTVTAVAVAVLRPSEQERFRSWLRDQPDVASVGEPRQALASGVMAARAFEPTERALLARPLDVDVVDRLGRAIVRYGAEHPPIAGTSVELRQGADVVLVSTQPAVNATSVTMLGAMREQPSVVEVDLAVHSRSAPFTATVRAGTDLAAAATALARSLPAAGTRWLGAEPQVAVRGIGVGNEVRIAAGAILTPAAIHAFTLAVRTDPGHPVALDALDGQGGTRSVLRLTQSSRTATTAAALHQSGYGLVSRGEAVEGAHGTIAMDEQAWAASRGAELSREPGVLAATIDVGSADEKRQVVADLRVEPQVSFEQVLRWLPGPVERVEVHTSPTAPDYDRDDALTPDPEVDCPTAAGGGLNLAYSGPRDRVPKAANYLAALRASALGATCVHWAERGRRGRPTTQTLLIRLPLREESWQAVLDVVRSRRADLGSAHPAVVLVLPVPGDRVTAVFNLPEGQAPFATALGAETQEQARAAQAGLQPLIRYWNARAKP
ncbi:MAG: hypothetical protein ABJA33_04895 [Pedococcus sp.]